MYKVDSHGWRPCNAPTTACWVPTTDFNVTALKHPGLPGGGRETPFPPPVQWARTSRCFVLEISPNYVCGRGYKCPLEAVWQPVLLRAEYLPSWQTGVSINNSLWNEMPSLKQGISTCDCVAA